MTISKFNKTQFQCPLKCVRTCNRGVKKETSQSLECANQWQYHFMCNKWWFRHECGSWLPATRGSQVQVMWPVEIQVAGHPPYSPDLSPCDYAIFNPLKKALRGKRFTSGRWRQAVCAELVHNADSHSPQWYNSQGDIQVLVSVPRLLACFFLNAPHI